MCSCCWWLLPEPPVSVVPPPQPQYSYTHCNEVIHFPSSLLTSTVHKDCILRVVTLSQCLTHNKHLLCDTKVPKCFVRMLDPRRGALCVAPGTPCALSNTGTPSHLQLSALTLALEAGGPPPMEMVRNLARIPRALYRITWKPRVNKNQKTRRSDFLSCIFFLAFLGC